MAPNSKKESTPKQENPSPQMEQTSSFQPSMQVDSQPPDPEAKVKEIVITPQMVEELTNRNGRR